VPKERVDEFEFEGHRLVYETLGDGSRVIVLLHGLLLDANLSRALAETLAGRGHRVVLLELLGHGRSDRPVHATQHRMDTYAAQTLALLDHLGIDQAVVGGTSLGANVALYAATQAPERLRGMIVEMPVLEWATPAAGLVFIPMLLAARFGAPILNVSSAVARRLPRLGFGPLDSFFNAWSMRPREIAAVLHGLLVGPIAPPLETRRRIQVPTLVIGHQRDAIHPFSDASNLVDQLPNARLVRARSIVELRLRPARLTREISAFVDEVWAR
jgi:pimeloyl-ACP methyl ester carboxylesterase